MFGRKKETKTHDVPAETLAKVTSCVMETDKGRIEIELYPADAPNTVANWYVLGSDGFYNDLTFHRVIPGFVAQGGCPQGTGTGGPGWNIACETGTSDHDHQQGSLSMAHAGKDTGGSQFFLVFEAQPHLDGVHTVFGQVTDGMDVMMSLKQGDQIKSITFPGV
ncbi:MAG: peptidylprolyl isomerase [Rhodospirillales bacterium]